MKRRKRINAPSSVAIPLMAATLSHLLLCACQQSDADDPQPAPRQPVALQLTSGIATTVTRAYDATWESGDEIGVFTVKAGSTSASDITYSGTTPDANIAYTATAGATYASGSVKPGMYNASNQTYNSFSPSVAPIYLPMDGSNVDVYAYYPYEDNITVEGGKSITLETTQTLAGQKTYDLLKANVLSSNSPVNIDNSTAKLLFEHCLSKVIIRVVVGEGYSEAYLTDRIDVAISGQATSATFKPVTQELTPNGSANIMPALITSGADYTAYHTFTDSGVETTALYLYRALLLPSTTSTTRDIIFSVGDKTEGAAKATYRYTIPQDLPGGQETVFTLTVSATDISVEASIEPWTTETITPEPLYELTQ